MSNGDSEDLEALFDSIAATRSEVAVRSEVPRDQTGPGGCPTQIFEHIGHAARKLHDAIKSMSAEDALATASSVIPDARDRLNYVASLTEVAANRVLNATDVAQPLVSALGAEAAGLDARWQKVFDETLPQAEFKPLVLDSRQFLRSVISRSDEVSGQLTEIMMSQDFQDLTGQVIKRLLAMVHDIEDTLVQLLVAAAPSDRRLCAETSLLNGPVINAGGTETVSNQEQVDDLLASLGF